MPERRESHRNRVVVVGGGLMGCACAWELARRGLQVTVLEKSVPGAEASSAAAGILGAQVEAKIPGAMTTLCISGRGRYRVWAEALHRATGIDIEYRPGGVLRVAPGRKGAEKLTAEVDWQADRGYAVRRVNSKAIRSLEPGLAPCAGGVFFPDDARVDPRKLLRALHVAAHEAGVHFRSGAYVKGIVTRRGRAVGVALEGGEVLKASWVVVAAGSWTGLVDGLSLEPGAVTPARGQIVELRSPAPILERTVFGPRCYLVPRDDGRTLVGSTLEFVGYRKEVTARAVRDLLASAIALAPGLADATVEDAWSNFRPYTEDGLPMIGPCDVDRLVLATGHYRNGILLAPITAEIVSALVRDKRPPVGIQAFSPARRAALAPRRQGT